MTTPRGRDGGAAPRRLVAAALLCVAAAAGCGLGAGASGGSAELTVTRDYGAEELLRANESSVPESETAMRMLERNAEVETRYGGRFVQSIEGLAGGEQGGRRFDWFFYVNGIESPVGAAEATVHVGERVWWDYRDWTVAMRVPAVVGSYPEPFAHGSRGKPVSLRCLGVPQDCGAVAWRMRRGAGIELASGSRRDALRVLVGPWQRVRADPAAAQIEDGPARSGVFADFEPAGGAAPAHGGTPYELVALAADGSPAAEPLTDAGLVAAVRLGERPPTWVVTGTSERGVRAALTLLHEDDLRDRYAVAVVGNRVMPLPAGGAGEGE